MRALATRAYAKLFRVLDLRRIASCFSDSRARRRIRTHADLTRDGYSIFDSAVLSVEDMPA